ncbi:MAG TPA: DUF2695 domain-containing protein [Pyrinomonadaceae bacterium]|jgi:hypothetical protein
MTTISEKIRRNQIKRTIKNSEREEILKTLPVQPGVLRKCFDFLNERLSKNGCDDTLNFTLEFIQKNNLPQGDLTYWLENNGGFCDCEVLANVEEKINDE